jgi:hypothetical protein
MKKKVIVVTDLGTFKAYRLLDDPLNSTPRLELIESFENEESRSKLSDRLTDEAGRFSRGTPGSVLNGNMANGERHNIALEQDRRSTRSIVERMAALVRAEDADGVYFAAAKEMNEQFLQEMPDDIRQKIEKNIPFNLTKVPKSELIEHFEIEQPG